MECKHGQKSIVWVFAVIFLVTAWIPWAQAAPGGTVSKTFAVFVVTYNTKTQEARGGVAGTAFFTSPQKAVTAFHVLQASSFRPPKGFDHTQVWLVHENEPAIEIKPENLRAQADKDITVIELKQAHVSNRYVFQTGSAPGGAPTAVRTEGFHANSTGPILQLVGGKVAILSVPHLDRLTSEGRLLSKAEVNLDADDVKLKSAPCLSLSYQPVVGLSGGPVISGGKVIGVNSFADPTTRTKTWAVAPGSIF